MREEARKRRQAKVVPARQVSDDPADALVALILGQSPTDEVDE